MCSRALELAKKLKRSICSAWIDLANAFGSVKHGLIQFMLNWYHVPDEVQPLFYAYYEGLFAKVFTDAWETDWFQMSIGVFQGCTASTVLFNGVFQLLLDMIRIEAPEVLHIAPPDALDGDAFDVSQLAYADDLSIMRSGPPVLQKALCVLDEGLKWTKTMKAKPKKCLSYGLRYFRQKNQTRPQSQQWPCPVRGAVTITQDGKVDFDTYNPRVYIGGKECPYLCDTKDGFKMLGKWIEDDLKHNKILGRTDEKLKRMLQQTDASLITGPSKVWIYQNFILAKLVWEFLVYPICETLMHTWDALATECLKRWLGIMKNANVGILYRKRADLGLAIRLLSDVAKKMQMTRVTILRASKDPHVLALTRYLTQCDLEKERWNPSVALRDLQGEMFIRKITRGAQSGRGGVGLRPRDKKKESWKAIFQDIREEDHIAKATQLVMAGAWLNWEGKKNYLADQLTLNAGLSRPGPQVLKFLLNTISNTNATAANHHRWYNTNKSCALCDIPLPGIRHILGACKVALEQHRYKWRHDSVLSHLATDLHKWILKHNAAKSKKTCLPRHTKIFVGAGEELPRRLAKYHPFHETRDWKLAADLPGWSYDFTRFSTSGRKPDLLIWSDDLKRLLVVELTVPCEENINSWHTNKIDRYLKDAVAAQACGWDTDIFAIEIGARGFVAGSLVPMLKAINYPSSQKSNLLNNISRIALECSTLLFFRRHAPHWEHIDLRT